ncbi:hypothetical protein OC835_006239, partial [Tilletia horrida]
TRPPLGLRMRATTLQVPNQKAEGQALGRIPRIRGRKIALYRRSIPPQRPSSPYPSSTSSAPARHHRRGG